MNLHELTELLWKIEDGYGYKKHCDATIRSWLEKKIDILQNGFYDPKDLMREILGLAQEKEECEHNSFVSVDSNVLRCEGCGRFKNDIYPKEKVWCCDQFRDKELELREKFRITMEDSKYCFYCGKNLKVAEPKKCQASNVGLGMCLCEPKKEPERFADMTNCVLPLHTPIILERTEFGRIGYKEIK